MANDVFNDARGKVAYYYSDTLGLSGANSRLVISLWSLWTGGDDAAADLKDIAALEAGSFAEADATGYARIQLAAAGVTWSKDATANTAKVVIDADQTWTSVSNDDSNGDINYLVCSYDPDNATGTDADILNMTFHTFQVTPNGGDITANFDQTNGIWSSS